MGKEKSSIKFNDKNQLKLLTQAFYQASLISFSLVFFPIVILLLGVWLDKRFSTTPLFIIIGIVLGIAVGIYQATRIKTNYQKGIKRNE